MTLVQNGSVEHMWSRSKKDIEGSRPAILSLLKKDKRDEPTGLQPRWLSGVPCWEGQQMNKTNATFIPQTHSAAAEENHHPTPLN